MEQSDSPRLPDTHGLSAFLSQQAQAFGLILVPIYALSFLSFLTTAAGVRLFCPEGIAGASLAAVGAVAIQTLLLICALNLYKHGARNKWTAIYIPLAIASIWFSYIGLFRSFSGGFITEEERVNYETEFDAYLLATTQAVAEASRIAHDARLGAEALAEHERSHGRTIHVIASQYLKTLMRRSEVDFRTLPQGSGTGPIFLFWTQIGQQLADKEQSLKAVESIIREAAGGEKLTTMEVGEKVAVAARLQNSVDWSLIQELMEGEGRPFTRPSPPAAQKEEKGITEKEWAINATRAIWQSWDPATVGVPLVLAVGLDLVVFIISIVFRERPHAVLGEADVLAALRAAEVNDGALSERALRAVVNRMRAASPTRWWLDASEVDRLEPMAIALVEQLERKGAIRPARSVSTTLRHGLREFSEVV